MFSGNQRFVKLLYLSAVCAFAFVLVYRTSISWSDATGPLQPDWPSGSHDSEPEVVEEPAPDQVMLVVASQTADNTTWLNGSFPAWEKSIYLTDAPSNLSVPANKGRESMVYLTYVNLHNISLYSTLTSYKLHNRQLRHPSNLHDLPTRQQIPMAQRRPSLRRPTDAFTPPTTFRQITRIRQPSLCLDPRMPG